MTLEIYAVGGFEEVGKNMAAVKVDDQIIILDMGLAMNKLTEWEQAGNKLDREGYFKCGALPNDDIIYKQKDKVAAIVISHGHLDHVGAVGFLAAKYNAPVVGTPYTIELLRQNLKEEHAEKPKQLIEMNAGEVLDVGDIGIEFVHSTHSIPQTVFPVLHTPEGVIFYGIDYKFDDQQRLTAKPDYKRLKKLGKDGIRALIPESVRVSEDIHTPSEAVARELLKDVIYGSDNTGKGMVISSFASHIERLNTIESIADKFGRRLIFAGRSMEKYTKVAETVGFKTFKDADIVGRPKSYKRAISQAAKNKGDYMIVATGSQGEPNSILGRMANNEFDYTLDKGDQVIFSCIAIPAQPNLSNRAILEAKIQAKGARVYRDIHVSGHAAREDHRELLNTLAPEHIIPCHGDIFKLASYAKLCYEISPEHEIGKSIHMLRNGKSVVL